MPKEQFPKLKGAAVNVPVVVSETVKKLPSTVGFILLKI